MSICKYLHIAFIINDLVINACLSVFYFECRRLLFRIILKYLFGDKINSFLIDIYQT